MLAHTLAASSHHPTSLQSSQKHLQHPSHQSISPQSSHINMPHSVHHATCMQSSQNVLPHRSHQPTCTRLQSSQNIFAHKKHFDVQDAQWRREHSPQDNVPSSPQGHSASNFRSCSKNTCSWRRNGASKSRPSERAGQTFSRLAKVGSVVVFTRLRR